MSGEPVGFVDEVRRYFQVDVTSATRRSTPPRTPSWTRCCRAAVRSPSGTRRTAGGRSARPTGWRRRSTRCPARCATGSAASTACPRWRRCATRWSPTSRGRGSTTTRATTGPGWRSTPTCRTGSASCRTWWRTSPTRATTPSTAARSSGWSSAPGARSTRSSWSTPRSASWPRGWPTSGSRPSIGEGWGPWAAEILGDLGLRFDGDLAERVAAAAAPLNRVRQDAALLLHDRGADADEVVAYLQRWSLVSEERARQQLRFLTDPLWRAYISTYVEGFELLSPLAGRPARRAAGGRPLPPAARRAADAGAAVAAELRPTDAVARRRPPSGPRPRAVDGGLAGRPAGRRRAVAGRPLGAVAGARGAADLGAGGAAAAAGCAPTQGRGRGRRRPPDWDAPTTGARGHPSGGRTRAHDRSRRPGCGTSVRPPD